MMLKNFENNTIGQATVIIAVFSLLAKILGLVRDAVFSHQFGAGMVIDAYYAAFRIPDFIYNLLMFGTFSVAFIPVFSEYLVKDKKEADKLASGILNMTFLIVLGATLLAYIFINPLVAAIAPGFDSETFNLTKTFTKIFLLSPIFLTLSSIFSSMLNTYKRFTWASIAPVVYNLSIIAGALLLYPEFGPIGVAVGVAVGAFLHFAVQIPQIIQVGFNYSLAMDYKEPGFIKFWKLYWPRIFSMGTEHVSALIITIFGSFLGTGALAGFYYANNLQSVFLGIFAVSFAISVFPILSDLHNQNDRQGFKDLLAKTTVQILFFIIPLSILLLVLRAQVVRLVLGIGESTNFSFTDTRIVAESLGLFSISLFAQSLIPLFSRAFYAMRNTVTPVLIGFVVISANIFITYYFVGRLGIAGMALSFSITSILYLVLLVMELHRRIGHIHDEYVIITSLKIIIASLFGGTAAYVSLHVLAPIFGTDTYGGILIQGSVSGMVGVGVYLLAGLIVGLHETRNLVNLLRSVGAKIGRPINTIWEKFT